MMSRQLIYMHDPLPEDKPAPRGRWYAVEFIDPDPTRVYDEIVQYYPELNPRAARRVVQANYRNHMRVNVWTDDETIDWRKLLK